MKIAMPYREKRPSGVEDEETRLSHWDVLQNRADSRRSGASTLAERQGQAEDNVP